MAVKEFYLRDPDDKRKEEYHQIDFASWMNYWYPHVYWFHPVNENALPGGKQYFVKQEKKGLRKGVVDIMILHRGIHGEPFGAIELKRATKTLSSQVSEAQWECLNSSDRQGAFSAVAYGHLSARQAVIEMLGPPCNITQ